MSKWWYVKLNEQHCEIRMGSHIVVGTVLEESFAKEICEARNKAQHLEQEVEQWKRLYDKLLERKERLVKAIQNGEEIHFAVLEGEVKGE
jgi:hypothetical protein